MQTVNVLNVYRTYFPDPPGGLQEAIRQICLATNSKGIKNTIYTLSPEPYPPELQRPEACVVRSRSWLAPASCDIGARDAVVKFSECVKQADIVHYFFPWPFSDALHAVKNPKKPAVLTYISDVVRQKFLGALYSPLMWRTLKSMDIIIANCPAYAETSPVLSHPSIRDRVRIIPLGIDEDSYPMDGDESIFQRINLNKKEPYLLFIGVLRYYKGLHTLIEAAENIDAKIVIAGSGPEGEKLRKMVNDNGLTNIIFSGQVTDKEKHSLLDNCRAFILPSHLRSEAYGMVLVEASMMSKPMVSCEIGTGTSFVNKHNETGFVVPPESPKELTKVVNVLLSDDRIAMLMGQNARKRYEELFSGEALGKAYSAVYKELMS